MSLRLLISSLLALALLGGCAMPHMKREMTRSAPGFAKPPATEGVLADTARAIFEEHGPEYSGFRLLDSSMDALKWRIALIDSAVSSLDIQTYLWFPDNAGRYLLERAVLAARRGVHVRLIVDDLLTIGEDQLIRELENHPHIEFRLFNPWKGRDLGSRGAEIIAEMERLNTRMHDKLIIVDGNAAIIGGRNIGDHYYGLSSAYDFHDLDLLGVGHIARQANGMFDHFWNSEWVVSADNLANEPDPEFAEERWQAIRDKNRAAPELQAFPREPKDWNTELAAVANELHPGTSYLVYDEATQSKSISQNMIQAIFAFMNQAEEELLITNAYIIPGQPAIDFFQQLTDRGVKTRILTNSLASHDVPAVNSHYKYWRDDLINAGAELYELRADPEIRALVYVPPTEGSFTGLHTKAAVVDREQVFIGSMNFDPRSARINTEDGAFVHSQGLGEALARVMERDMQPENAWQVLLNDEGKPYWVNSDERVDTQPARDGMQRVMDVIFEVVPKEQY
ncbi:MAG: phospholipase D family protein [Pseudomonadota bacterium]